MYTPSQWADMLSPQADIVHAGLVLREEVKAFLSARPDTSYTTTQLAEAIAPGLSPAVSQRFFNVLAWLRKHQFSGWVHKTGVRKSYGREVAVYHWRALAPFTDYAKPAGATPQVKQIGEVRIEGDMLTLPCPYCRTMLTLARSAPFECSNPDCPGDPTIDGETVDNSTAPVDEW